MLFDNCNQKVNNKRKHIEKKDHQNGNAPIARKPKKFEKKLKKLKKISVTIILYNNLIRNGIMFN